MRAAGASPCRFFLLGTPVSSTEQTPEIASQLAQWAQQVNEASPIKPVAAPPPPPADKGRAQRKKKRRRS